MIRNLVIVVFLGVFITAVKGQVYKVPQGGTETVKTCGGIVSDQLIESQNYSNNSLGQLIIEPDSGFLSLTFESFSLEQDFDFLRIYNGPSTDSALIGEYSGENVEMGTIRSTNSTGALLLEFESDATKSLDGFFARIKCQQQIPVPKSGLSSVSACSGKVTDHGGDGRSFSSDADGVLTLSPLPGQGHIELDFSEFNINANDRLYIYDGGSVNDFRINDYRSFDQLGVVRAMNEGGQLTLRFVSSLNSINQGFYAELSCTDDSTINYRTNVLGSENFTTCSGVLTDDGGVARNISGETNSLTTIYPDSGFVVLDFEEFSIGNNYFEIFDGTTITAPSIGVFSNTNDIGQVVSSNPAGALTVRIENEFSSNVTGFVAQISCVNELPKEYRLPISGTVIDTSCTGTLTDDGGEFDPFTSGAEGVFTLYPNESGQFVELTFGTIYTGTNENNLSVFDGVSTGAPLIGSYHKANTPGLLQASNPLGALTVEFNAIETNTPKSGFKAIVSCGVSLDEVINLPFTGSQIDTACSGLITDDGGKSGVYGDFSNGTTTIYPDSGFLTLAFQAFDLNSSGSRLLIYDGPNTSDLLFSADDTFFPEFFSSTHETGALTLKFEGGDNGTTLENGFVAEVGCRSNVENRFEMPISGSLVDTTCSGGISDDGGVFVDYTSFIDGTYTLFPDSGYLELCFSDFMTGSDAVLTIYDGVSDTSSVLGSYSNFLNPGSLYATNDLGALTLKFQANENTFYDGFSAMISCIQELPLVFNVPSSGIQNATTCAGLLADNGGIKGVYADNSDGVLTIYPDDTSKFVKVKFTEYELSSWPNTSKLYVYDGPSTNEILIGAYGVSDSPDTVYASNQEGALTFRFESGLNQNISPGFIANIGCLSSVPEEYKMPISGSEVVYTCSGVVADDGGVLGAFSSNVNGVLTLYPDNNKAIQLDFTSFGTGALESELSIYDGASVNSPLLASFHNSQGPGEMFATNESGALTLSFNTSINDGAQFGFSAEISCPDLVSDDFRIPSKGSLSVSSCSGTVNDNHVNNNGLKLSEGGVLTVWPDEAGKFISLDFSTENLIGIELGSYVNNLEVYNGPTINAPLIGRYRGYDDPDEIFSTHPSGAITLQLSISVESLYDYGFTGQLSCRDEIPEVYTIPKSGVGSVTTCSGQVADDGGINGQYESLADGELTIYPILGYLELDFSAFYAPHSQLYIYDGTTSSAPLIGTYSNSNNPGVVSGYSSTGALTLRFDAGVTGNSGFAANISCKTTTDNDIRMPISGNRETERCYGTLSDDGGINSAYTSNADGTFSIYPEEEGEFVQLDFKQFDLGNSSSRVYIYDGSTVSSNTLIDSYSSSNIPSSIHATNSSGVLTVRFDANSNYWNDPGFSANISCLSEIPLILQMDKNSSKSAKTCNAQISDDAGVNADYSGYQNSTLTIIPEIGKVALDFTEFATRENIDVLHIYDGTSRSDELLGTISGFSFYSKFTATNPTGALTIYFEVPSSNSYYDGFVATATCIGTEIPETPEEECIGENITMKMLGDLTFTGCDYCVIDNGEGIGYNKDSYDRLTIEPALSGYAIQAKILKMETEDYDIVSVFDGASISAKKIGEFSNGKLGAIAPKNPNGNLTILFDSDGSISDKGFLISTSCVSQSSLKIDDPYVYPLPAFNEINVMDVPELVFIEAVSLDGVSFSLPNFTYHDEIVTIDIKNLGGGTYTLRMVTITNEEARVNFTKVD